MKRMSYNNLTTKTKLLISFSFIILLVVPLVMLHVSSMTQTNKNFNEIVNGSYPKLQVLFNTKLSANTIRELANNLSLEPKNANNSKYKLLAAIDGIRKEKDEYTQLINKYPDHEVININELDALANRIILSTLALVDEKKNSEDSFIPLKNDILQKNISALNEFIDHSISKNQKIIFLLQNAAQNTLHENIKISLLLSALIGLVCLLISIIISKKISKPLVQLTNTALRIARPDFNLNQFNPNDFNQFSHRKDEVGQLSLSLQKMTQAISMKQNELQRLVKELSISETYNNAIFNSAMDGMISVDSTGIIQEKNSAASIILRCEKDKTVIGKKITKYIGLDWLQVKNNPPQDRFEYIMTCVDDKQIPIELTIVKIKNIVPERYTLFIRDLSQPKEIEHLVELRNRITKTLAFSHGVEEALQKTLEVLVHYYSLYAAEFWKVNTSKNTLKRHTIVSSPQGELFGSDFHDYKEQFFEITCPPSTSFKKDLWEKKEIIYCDEKHPNSFDSELLNKIIPTKGMVGVPLEFENELVGLIILYFQVPFTIDAPFLEFINPIANQLGPFLARIKNQDEIIHLNKKLVESARQGGMVEVATNILHNVGNVLNSVNISIFTLKNVLQKNHMNDLKQISELIRANSHQLTEFINTDEKGKLLLDYFDKLSTKLIDERTHFKNEIAMLIKNVEHIKNIIALQQKIAGSAGFTETVILADVIDDSIKISLTEEFSINIQKEYRINKPVIIDKIKVQQIVVNLIRNAKESLIESSKDDKEILINLSAIKKEEKNWIEIKIQDNGTGILAEHLIRIFNFGFTTKKTGHGFGLHASIISAKELGGSLVVSSEGLNKGATFTLYLPHEPYQQKSMTEIK